MQVTPILNASDVKVAEAVIVTTGPEHINVMLDLETLGKKPGCKILTLSAVTFGEGVIVRNYFDAAIRVDTQDLLRTDKDTVDWWEKQSAEAKKAAFENVNALTLVKVLALFSEWCKALPAKPIIWGNGASFDEPILGEAYDVYKIPRPWHYRDARCYRTLRAEFMHLVSESEFKGEKHTSMADAVHQANYAEKLLSILPTKCIVG